MYDAINEDDTDDVVAYALYAIANFPAQLSGGRLEFFRVVGLDEFVV